MDTSIILEDIFEVKNMNPDGKKFDKVSRLICESENYEMDLVLDVNTDIYPIEPGERLTLALATSLDLKGRGDQGYWDYGESERATLADRYEYVMYGRVFKYSPDSRQEKVYVYIYIYVCVCVPVFFFKLLHWRTFSCDTLFTPVPFMFPLVVC